MAIYALICGLELAYLMSSYPGWLLRFPTAIQAGYRMLPVVMMATPIFLIGNVSLTVLGQAVLATQLVLLSMIVAASVGPQASNLRNYLRLRMRGQEVRDEDWLLPQEIEQNRVLVENFRKKGPRKPDS